MTDFKELREALDRHAAVADPALLKDRQAWEQYRDDAYTIQYWGHEHRLRLLLDRLEAAERDARRYRWLRTFPNNINRAMYGPCLIPNDSGLLRRDDYLDAAIDAMKGQQP